MCANCEFEGKKHSLIQTHTVFFFISICTHKHNYILCKDVPLQDVTEDGHHCFIIKLVDSDGVEMPQKTRGHGVTATTCTSSDHFNLASTHHNPIH